MRLVWTHSVDDLGPVFSFGLPSVQDEKNDILHHRLLVVCGPRRSSRCCRDASALACCSPLFQSISTFPRRFPIITTPTSKSLERRQPNCWRPMRRVWKREAGRGGSGTRLGLDSEVTLVIWLNRRSLQHQPRVFPGPIPGHGRLFKFSVPPASGFPVVMSRLSMPFMF